MTDETPRCEPPPELRDRDGWHWVDADRPIVAFWYAATDWSSECWRINSTQYSPQGAQKRGYRYVAPAIPPAVVAALVEALEGLATHAGHLAVLLDAASGVDFRDDAAIYKARAALAAYREVGR